MLKLNTLLALSGCLAVVSCASDGLPELPPASEQEPARDVASLMRLGDRMRLSGNFTAAANFYNEALAQDPLNIDVLNRLADINWQSGALQDAAGYYAQILSIDPGNSEALSGRARVLMAERRPYEALDMLNQLEAEHGATTDSIYSRGLANDLLGRQKVAQILYDEALKQAPADIRIRNALALSKAISEDYRGAVDILRQIADSQPQSSNVRESLALVYALSGQVDIAVELGSAVEGGASAAALRVFYSRLLPLTPVQKAEAIYFRRLPEVQQAPPRELPIPVPQPKVVQAPKPEETQQEAPQQEEPLADPIEENVETASTNSSPSDLGPVDVVTTGGYFVQLGSFRRLEAVELAWAQVSEKSALAASELFPRVQNIETDDRGVYLRVVVGPYEAKTEARMHCDALKRERVDCLVVYNELPATSLTKLLNERAE